MVILELAGGLQLLLTLRGGGDGREDILGLGTGPRDSIFSRFPASPVPPLLTPVIFQQRPKGSLSYPFPSLSLCPLFLLLSLLLSLITICSFSFLVFSQ